MTMKTGTLNILATTLVAAAAMTVPALAQETTTETTLTPELKEGSTTAYTVGDGSGYSGYDIINITYTGGSHEITANLGTDFNGTLNYTGNLRSNLLTIGDGATINLSSNADTTNSIWGGSSISNALNFKTDYKIISGYTFSGKVTSAADTTLSITDGSSTFSGGADFAGTVAVGNGASATFGSGVNLAGGLSFSNGEGTAIFTEGATVPGAIKLSGGASATISGNVSADRYVGTDSGANTSTTLTAGSVMNITGTATDSSSGNSGAFTLAHWNATNTFDVNGTLNLNSGVSIIDGRGELNINNGGEVNFQAGLTTTLRDWQSSETSGLYVTLAEGGTMNIGANGIKAESSYNGKSEKFTLTLNGGTVGSLADSWSSSSDLTLGGAVTIDTTKKQMNTTGKATAVDGATGTAIELFGVISGDSGSLTLAGTDSGKLTLSGANTYKGGTTVSAGTLVANNASALGGGNVKVENGAHLEVAADVTLNQTTITVVLNDEYLTVAALGGSGVLADGTKIVITAADEATAAQVASFTLDAEEGVSSYKILGGNLASSSASNVTFEISQALQDQGWKAVVSDGSGNLVLSVPEPSAFGLLAGLGALALVASRRRRTKRA